MCIAQCGLGRGLPTYQVASWSIQLFGHNRHGPKSGDDVPLLWRARSPSNTKWSGPRPISMSSFILIYATVWNTPTSQTDRQTGQRYRPIA